MHVGSFQISTYYRPLYQKDSNFDILSEERLVMVANKVNFIGSKVSERKVIKFYKLKKLFIRTYKCIVCVK